VVANVDVKEEGCVAKAELNIEFAEGDTKEAGGAAPKGGVAFAVNPAKPELGLRVIPPATKGFAVVVVSCCKI